MAQEMEPFLFKVKNEAVENSESLFETDECGRGKFELAAMEELGGVFAKCIHESLADLTFKGHHFTSQVKLRDFGWQLSRRAVPFHQEVLTDRFNLLRQLAKRRNPTRDVPQGRLWLVELTHNAIPTLFETEDATVPCLLED
jgi:hypothetical protein